MDRSRTAEVIKTTAMLPDEYGKMHKGTQACTHLSIYIFELWLKIQNTEKPAQLLKFAELEQAYIDIVNDLSHVYRLELTVDAYQYKIAKLMQENAELHRENNIMKHTIDFDKE